MRRRRLVSERIHDESPLVDQDDVGLRALQFVYQPQGWRALPGGLPRQGDHPFVGPHRHALQPRPPQARAQQGGKPRRPRRRLEAVRGQLQALPVRVNGEQKLLHTSPPQSQEQVLRTQLEDLGNPGPRQAARQFIRAGFEEEDIHGTIRLWRYGYRGPAL